MKKTALILMILAIITKTLGFSRDIILSYFYGVSSISDAYLISIIIPTTIVSFIGTGIATTYIPMYSNIIKERGLKYADKFTNYLINLLLIICTIMISFVLVFTEQIVKLFASGFEGEVFDLAVSFTRISSFAMYFAVLIYLFSGYLNLKKSFTIPAVMSMPLNLIIMLSIVLSYNVSLNLLAIGMVIAMGFQMLFLIPFVYKRGFRYNLVLDVKDKYIKRLIVLSLPVILGVSVNQINVLVDRTMASQISIGGISALNYADRLNVFVQGIFVMSIITVMYPLISKMASDKNIKGLKDSISGAISGISLLVTPVAIGAMIFAEPLVALLFGRGAFDDSAILMTSYALFYYSIGMVGFALRELLSRAFYSLQDTKTPMTNAAIAMVLNIILNIVLSKFMGIGGLALATSISGIFCSILLFISLRRKIGSFGIKNILITFIKVLIASLVMGAVLIISQRYFLLYINKNLSLLISIPLGALVYSIVIYFMKIKEVSTIIISVKQKLKLILPN